MRKVPPAIAENVYARFIEFEERAAAIYFRFASHFSANPQLSSFWFDMGMEEKHHAGLLQFCVCDSLFAPDLPKDTAIGKVAALFERIERLAESPSLTVEGAFALAIEIESSEVNTIYAHLTTPLHDSMYLSRRKIVTSARSHLDELIAAASKFGVEARSGSRA